jgi:hypothetical protein
MSKRAKIIASISAVVVLLIVGIFSYRSYTNISVKDSNPTVSSKRKVADAKTNNKNTKSKKNDSNIFLQDQNNPDRIIAIHPFGSDGVYQYRQSADGTLYPEYKFFDGSYSLNSKGLKVSPYQNSKQTRSFDFSKRGNNYFENGSNNKYHEIAVNQTSTGSNASKAPKNTNSDNDSNSAFLNGKRITSENETDFRKKIYNSTSDLSDPSRDPNKPQSAQYHSAWVHRDNGDFINPKVKLYMGFHFNAFNVADYNPQKLQERPENKDKVMYYKNNNQTVVSPEEAQENSQFTNDATNGDRNYF